MGDIHESDPESTLSSGRDVYYIQSGKKREVRDFQTYLNLKTQLTKGKGEIDDRTFVNFLPKTTLDQIPDGPKIFRLSDTFVDHLLINIYPQTLIEYESGEEAAHPVNFDEEVAVHVERYHWQRIVTSYVPATDTKSAKIKAINTMGEKGDEVLIEVSGSMDLQDYHDLAAMRMAEKLNWIPKYYLLRAITNWGDPEKDESLLSGFIYLLRERS